MNFRTELVNALFERFMMQRDKSGSNDPTHADYDPEMDRNVPIEIEAVNLQTDTPVNPDSYNKARPGVIFAYGDVNRLQGEPLVGADYESFTVIIYTYINTSSPTENDLVNRQGDMDTLVRNIVRSVRSMPPDGVFLEDAYINKAETDKGKLGQYAHIVFEIVFVYQSLT